MPHHPLPSPLPRCHAWTHGHSGGCHAACAAHIMRCWAWPPWSLMAMSRGAAMPLSAASEAAGAMLTQQEWVGCMHAWTHGRLQQAQLRERKQAACAAAAACMPSRVRCSACRQAGTKATMQWEAVSHTQAWQGRQAWRSAASVGLNARDGCVCVGGGRGGTMAARCYTACGVTRSPLVGPR